MLGAQTKQKLMVQSSIDKSLQPCYIIVPDGYDASGSTVYPVLMALHVE